MSTKKIESRIEDRFTRILPVPGNRISLKKPILVTGFPDSGMIGSITINYLIEYLEMHQIAFIESQFIMPAALFIGKRFRHPFRIYSTSDGRVCTLICELPINSLGIYSVINTVANWCKDSGIVEVIVVGGIGQGNFSPSGTDNRRALLLQAGDSDEQAESSSMDVPSTALITGLAGALLSTCAARNIDCKGVVVPAFVDVPDPEGAAILLESLAKMVPALKVDTLALRKQGEMIKKQMDELLKMHRNSMREYGGPSATASAENTYK